MRKNLLLFSMLFIKTAFCQYSDLNTTLDRTQFCSQSSIIKISGTVTASPNVYADYHFVGMIFHFYYLGGSLIPIGTYTINTTTNAPSTSYSTINSVYFDGSQISGAQVLRNTYNPGTSIGGGQLSVGFNLPWYALLNTATNQFFVAVEAIDQSGSTTVLSPMAAFTNPILYPKAILTKPAISTTTAILCGSTTATIATNPDLTGSYTYNWYKDGSWLTTETGATINVSSPGTYFAYIYDACQNVSTDNIVIGTGIIPGAPTIASSNGTLLCNGSSTTLSTSPSGGGVIHWSTGQTGNSIAVSTAGNYYAYEVNNCGTSANSNTVSISVSNTPAAPNIVSSNGTLLCNGASTTLSTSPLSGGLIHWSTGATGNAITVSSAGNYYANEANSCGVSANSSTVAISVGSTPTAPTIASTAGTNLCNSISTVLNTTPSTTGGIIHWSTGQTGNSITISSAGSYYAYEAGSCGTSSNSNTISITVGITPPAPSVVSSNGSLLCNGISTSLSTSPAAGGTIHWNTGGTGNSITISGAGSYYGYEVNGCGSGPNSNTVNIVTGNAPAAPTVSPSSNQLLCNGASATLSSTGNNISWSSGTTGNTLVTATAGSYYTTDHNSCGNSPAGNTVVISTGTCPQPAPGSSFFVCPGTVKTLDAGAGYDTYSWSDGETTQKISVGPGTYSVTVTKNGCSATSSAVTVNYYTVTVPTITPSGPTTICASGSVTLAASMGNAYLWSNGATSSSITVNTSGGYYVTVTDANGCNVNSGATNVTVNSLPTASISGSVTVCQNSTSPFIYFTGSGGTAPYTFVYKLNGGANQSIVTTSGNSVSLPVSTTTAGSYTYSLVSVQESSSTACSSVISGSVTVSVNPLPTAAISGSATVCQNSASPFILLTGNGGSAPYTFVYKLNGGSSQTVTTTSGNSVKLAVPTNAAGTLTYSLVSVQESSSTSCSNTASGSATVVVSPLPSAVISGSTTVCRNSVSPVITFAGSGGTSPYTFGYKVNGGPVQTVSTTSGNSVTVNAPTNTAGTFIYSLVSVQDASLTGCSNTATGTATVVVNDLPTATIGGTTTVCQNSIAPVITFTGSGGTAPYTFAYKINTGSVQTVSTTSGNSVTVNASTNSAGTFTYSLVSVKESSATACSSNISGNATVVINPLPSATITGSATVCQNETSPVLTFAGSGGITPYTFSYTMNGGALQTVSGNNVRVSVPTSKAGTYTYTLVSVQDNSATTCVAPASGNAIITISPQPAIAIITAPAAHLCNGAASQITITNFVPGYSYAWYKDGMFLKMSTGDTIMNNKAGSFYVLPTSDKGCAAATGSDTIIISTGTISKPVITGYLHVCPGGKTRLGVLPTDIGQPFEVWRWTDMPYGRLRSEDSIFSAFAGQYQLSVEREGCYDSAIVAITADDTDFPAGRLVINPARLAYGAQAVLTADVTGAVQFEWNLGDGNTAKTSANTILENYYTTGDSLRISVIAVSERNCRSPFTGFINVDPPVIDSVKNNAFTGNLKDWNIFPTPFHVSLKVSVILLRNETVRLDLFTADGKWVKAWSLGGTKGENLFQLDGLETLLPGVVYLITGSYNGMRHFDKIAKY